MLEQQLGQQSGGDIEPIAESPTWTEDAVQAVTMAGSLMTGLERNSQPDMHMAADACVAQIAGLPQQCAPWPTTTKLAEPNAIVIPTEKFGLDCGLTSPDMALSMALDEHMGLSNANSMLPMDVDISHLMLADLCVGHSVSHSTPTPLG